MDGLDKFDVHILAELQSNADLTNSCLAQRVGLSPQSCQRRLQRLHENNYIRQHVTLLNRQALGFKLIALVQVSVDLQTSARFERFQTSLSAHENVIECDHVVGMSCDYQLKLLLNDVEHYYKFLKSVLFKIEGVCQIRSSFVVKQIKETTELPINRMSIPC